MYCQCEQFPVSGSLSIPSTFYHILHSNCSKSLILFLPPRHLRWWLSLSIQHFTTYHIYRDALSLSIFFKSLMSPPLSLTAQNLLFYFTETQVSGLRILVLPTFNYLNNHFTDSIFY